MTQDTSRWLPAVQVMLAMAWVITILALTDASTIGWTVGVLYVLGHLAVLGSRLQAQDDALEKVRRVKPAPTVTERGGWAVLFTRCPGCFNYVLFKILRTKERGVRRYALDQAPPDLLERVRGHRVRCTVCGRHVDAQIDSVRLLGGSE